jgi:hypothetical protein
MFRYALTLAGRRWVLPKAKLPKAHGAKPTRQFSDQQKTPYFFQHAKKKTMKPTFGDGETKDHSSTPYNNKVP